MNSRILALVLIILGVSLAAGWCVVILPACAPSRAPVRSDDSATIAIESSERTKPRNIAPIQRQYPAGRPQLVCGVFAESLSGSVLIADLRLRSGNGNRIANPGDIKRIEDAGGTVLHRFNVALVRARLDTGALRALVSPSGIADYATVVTDTSRRDVSAQIFFARPVSSSDMRALQNLNVSTSRIPPRPKILYAVAPDDAIPQIQRMRGVDFVRARAITCESDF